MTSTLLDVAEALPNHFQFYHLGNVELKSEFSPLRDDNQKAIGFKISGDMNALLILVFEKSLDPSIYSEIGNIIASQTAMFLSSKKGVEIITSPPYPLNDNQFERLVSNCADIVRKTYAHLYEDSVVHLETVVLPWPSEGIGYA